MKRSPMLVSVAIPYTINGMEGGMSIPKDPLVATMPVENILP
jgi:hypothetical protein